MSDINDEQMIPTPSDFGHFVLEKELGHGGMGGVYLARDKMLDRKVAIKVMLKSLGDDPAFVERFKREAQAAARLNHPNIAQIYSFGQENGMPYIAMELVGGGSLDKEMEGHLGLLDPIHIMKVGYQVAEGLALAAEQNLVHGDVKPENVLYDLEGNAKLVDFGLAAMQGTEEIWGTPYYISPEKVRRQKADYRADIYSLGATLYHAITGVAPFEGIDATAVVRARFEKAPRLPSTIRQDLPKEIDTILMRMLELEPAMRYPTYSSLLGDFKRFLQKAGSEKSTRIAGKVKIVPKKAHVKISMPSKPAAVSVDDHGGAEQPEEGAAVAPVKPLKPLVAPQPKGMNVGKAVGLTVAIIIVVVLSVVGGLIWYVNADKQGKQAAEQAQCANDCRLYRQNISVLLAKSEKFVKNFDEFVTTADRNMINAQRDMKSRLTPAMIAQAGMLLNPPMSKEIAEAIAYTNKLLAVKEEPKKEEPKKDDAAKDDATKKSDASAKKADGKQAADAKKDGGKKVAETKTNDEAEADRAMAEQEARLAGKPLPKAEKKTDKKAEDAAVADAVEKAKKVAAAIAPGAKVEVKVFKVDLPSSVRDLAALWPDVYTCRAALIRVKGHYALIKRMADRVEQLGDNDFPTKAALEQLQHDIEEEDGRMRGLKCVEQTQRKAGIIREKSQKLLGQAIGQIVAAKKKLEAEMIKAKEDAEKAAKDAAAAKRKAELKVAEPKMAKDKFAELVGSRLRNLDWEPALKQLRPFMETFETDEGRAEARSQIEKVECMQALHQAFIKHGKGFKFKDGTSIKAVDEKTISIQKIKYVKGHQENAKVEVVEWVRFYGKPEHVKQMNQMLNTLIIKGRETTKAGPLLWSKQMLGAALTLELLYTDVPGAAEMAPVLVKKCTKEFSDSARWAKQWFPKVEIEVSATDE